MIYLFYANPLFSTFNRACKQAVNKMLSIKKFIKKNYYLISHSLIPNNAQKLTRQIHRLFRIYLLNIFKNKIEFTIWP